MRGVLSPLSLASAFRKQISQTKGGKIGFLYLYRAQGTLVTKLKGKIMTELTTIHSLRLMAKELGMKLSTRNV